MAQYSLGIDLDNVTADYTKLLQNYMRDVYGWSVADTPLPTSYNWIESDGWPFTSIGNYLSYHNEMVRRGGFLNAEPIEGAVETINKLQKDHGISIDIITHRIFGTNAYDKMQAVNDTYRWLFNNKIEPDNIAFYSHKEKVAVDCLVDDSPSNITAVRDNGGYVIVFDQLYNRGLHEPRAYNWNDVYRMVLEHKKRLER